MAVVQLRNPTQRGGQIPGGPKLQLTGGFGSVDDGALICKAADRSVSVR